MPVMDSDLRRCAVSQNEWHETADLSPEWRVPGPPLPQTTAWHKVEGQNLSLNRQGSTSDLQSHSLDM